MEAKKSNITQELKMRTCNRISDHKLCDNEDAYCSLTLSQARTPKLCKAGDASL